MNKDVGIIIIRIITLMHKKVYNNKYIIKKNNSFINQKKVLY